MRWRCGRLCAHPDWFWLAIGAVFFLGGAVLKPVPLSDADRRLLYRARRGLKELDFYLAPYVQAHFVQANAEERAVFGRLMAAEDPDLLDWFLGVEVPADAAAAALIARIRALRHADRAGQ